MTASRDMLLELHAALGRFLLRLLTDAEREGRDLDAEWFGVINDYLYPKEDN